MFEKEAEEWRNSLNYEIDNDTFYNIVIPCIEFGYNKAKEKDKWHKVHIMEGFVDLPDEEGDYLCCLQDGDELMYEVMGISIDGNGDCYLESMIWAIDELIAWKEITPPNED